MSNSFSADISKFAKKFNADVKTVIRKISFEAFSRIVLRTPVDTGRARANWGVQPGTPITFAIEAQDKSGSATLAATANGTLSWECQGSLFFTNNVPYIGVLEYGKEDGTPGSTQAPNGMVRVTMEEMLAWIKTNGKKGI